MVTVAVALPGQTPPSIIKLGSVSALVTVPVPKVLKKKKIGYKEISTVSSRMLLPCGL
jgi:hypothetical protein